MAEVNSLVAKNQRRKERRNRLLPQPQKGVLVEGLNFIVSCKLLICNNSKLTNAEAEKLWQNRRAASPIFSQHPSRSWRLWVC